MALTHFDKKGDAHMVDVSDKADTDRIAVAAASEALASKRMPSSPSRSWASARTSIKWLIGAP